MAWIVGFYKSSSFYREGVGKFDISKLDNLQYYSHLVYCSFDVSASGEVTYQDKSLDIDKKNIENFIGLKSRSPNLVFLASFVGKDGIDSFSKLAADSKARANFAYNSQKFLKMHGFDGVNIHLEYAVNVEGKPEDKVNFLSLLTDLKAIICPQYTLTVSVSGFEAHAEVSYDIQAISNNVSLVNLVTFDLHGVWDKKALHCTPLKMGSNDATNTDRMKNYTSCVKYWLGKGVDNRKLCLGISAFGRTYTTVSDKDCKLGSAVTGPGYPGVYTNEAGILATYEFAPGKSDWKETFDNEQEVPYCTDKDQFISYDNFKSVQMKAYFIEEVNINAMIYTIDYDDFSGHLGQAYPITSTVYSILNLVNKKSQ